MITSKQISVAYQLYEGQQQFSIPVSYEIIEEGARTVYSCRVALAPSDLPGWLSLQSFDIPKVFQNGVTITCLSQIKGMKNIDTSLFIIAVEQAITVNEMVSV